MPRVLVVDDAPVDREVLGRILRDAGCEVLTATNGVEALELARRFRPALVLMDIVMPEMDGFSACRRLAADRVTRGVPVVFVSSKSQRADRMWARMQGGLDLIGKPIEAGAVLQTLRHAHG
ncbi:MAG: response regulator [Burkholderiaceae bacterium]|nr:response regulator [Burkholderiaceae bacterium]